MKRRARKDPSNLLLWSRRNWGTAQRDVYAAAIQRVLDDPATYPEMDRVRDEFYQGCRCLPVEQHMIYYHLRADRVVVDRILHGKQDPAEVFRDEPST